MPIAMELEFSDLSTKPSGGTAPVASWEELGPIVARFTAEPVDSGAFVILRAEGIGYVQAARSAQSFMLEHHSDASDCHYQCPPPVTGELVTEVFRLFLEAPATILEMAAWEEIDL
jgi:hypothetical protein